LEVPGPIGLGLLGLDLEVEALLLAELEELLAEVLALRIDIVLTITKKLEFLGDISGSAGPGLIVLVDLDEGSEAIEVALGEDAINDLVVPGPIGLGLLGLDLEGDALGGALLEELLAVVPTLRIDIVLSLLKELLLVGNISAGPGLISVVGFQEKRKIRHCYT